MKEESTQKDEEKGKKNAFEAEAMCPECAATHPGVRRSAEKHCFKHSSARYVRWWENTTFISILSTGLGKRQVFQPKPNWKLAYKYKSFH